VLVTVHGVVRNAATGEPLPRALVRIEGDADTGVLTGGDGRFEIPAVPAGPQAIQVLKPGFRDRPYAAGLAAMEETIGPAHSVLAAAEMPELAFALAPTCSIHGQIELSTGDPAQGIFVLLLRRMVQDGRAVWRVASVTKANSGGAYRFAGLADGVYAIHTEPAMDSEPAMTLVEAGKVGSIARAGYASVFYPDARDLAGAAKISISNGQQAEANFALALEPFHTVSATAVAPKAGSSREAALKLSATNDTVRVLEAADHQLIYPAQFDQATNTIQAVLPDGTYTLLVWSPQRAAGGDFSRRDDLLDPNLNPGVLAGSVDFSVAGHAVTNLRLPVSPQPTNPMQLTVLRSATQPFPTQTLPGLINVLANQTGGWISEGMTTLYAQDVKPGTNPTANLPPGAYWMHTVTAGTGLCEQSFTAGGANLAREPLVLSISGSVPPMELTLRHDCAKLALSLPQALSTQAPGEEPSYTVYVVPDFDSTLDVGPLTLRPSTGGTLTLESLTPGSYHVFTFDAPVRLEYRNPAVLAAMPNPGQQVTLSPSATSNLVLEVPGH
jgi:hypothetical protein